MLEEVRHVGSAVQLYHFVIRATRRIQNHSSPLVLRVFAIGLAFTEPRRRGVISLAKAATSRSSPARLALEGSNSGPGHSITSACRG